MIKETDGDSFEVMRSVDQDLTFEAVQREFEIRGIDFGRPQMKTLRLISEDSLYTNLGLLLSDQCPHVIKVAVFEGTDQNVFKDRREFSGSLTRQLDEIYEYIDLQNKNRATFDKLLRIDSRDYPETAVREALLNTLVHRDYSFSASSLISIYDDRIEFVSLGGLAQGIELEDLALGVSVCRNPGLANVFYRLQLIEAHGTGMKKIMGACAGLEKAPQVMATSNAFKIVLPNMNAMASAVNDDQVKLDEKNKPASSEEKVLTYLEANLCVSRKQVQELLGVGQAQAGRVLTSMVDGGLIRRVGGGRTTRYEIVAGASD